MSAEIVDFRAARARASLDTPAHRAWEAFVAAKLRAEATSTVTDMRAAVEAYDAMVAAFEAFERNQGRPRP